MNLSEKQIEQICKIANIDDIGELSDGFHTFNSLYHQRAILFATIVNTYKELAKSLYDNFDALRKTEYETSTRFDLVLVKWNQSNRNIDDWDEFCSYADINPLERSNV